MSAEKPDYHDADLILRVYEMRREAKTREHRDLLNFNFWPKSFEDIQEVQKSENPMNAGWRQLSGYWEMVYGLARNGIVNADYLVENNAEGLFHFAKVAPYLAQIRENGNESAFQSVEWASKESEAGRKLFPYFQGIVEQYTKSGD